MDLNQNTEGFEEIAENEEVVSVEENIEETPQIEPNFTYEIKKEKIQIKRDGNILGAAFLSSSAIIYLLNVAVYILSFVLSFVSRSAAEFLFEPALMHIFQVIFSFLGFLLPFVVIFKLADVRISSIISFSKPKKEHILPFTLMGLGFCAFSNILVNFTESFFSKTNINYDVPQPETPEGIFGFMLVLISTVFIPALMEEFVCRGLILGHLKKYGDGFAVIISSLLFGVMHGNFEQTPFAFLVGLVLGYITIKSKTIWIAVFVHGFNNLISVVMSYLPKNLIGYGNLGYLIYIVLVLLGGIIALLMLSGKDDDLYKFEMVDSKISGGKKVLCFLTAAPILVYFIICLIDSVQYFF